MNTTDICDRLGERVSFLSPAFQNYGGRLCFSGDAVTIKCFEDSSRVKELIATPGHGKVMVIEAGGSPRCAVLGDVSARIALDNGWEGIIVHGYLRDVAAIGQMALGVRALGVVPKGSTRRGEGITGLPVDIGGVCCRPGDQVYADENGIVIVARDDGKLLTA
ncbi:putative regulator of ribonuclease activity [compost metagenome]